ncbi:hypothetical protein LMG28140_06050 [Paraburkholderia metrosideri]|uniref:Glycine zipper domain-containing protein n=1 Tax=Paraburkholderia metrosideri TaxID=580937 RepID=A0ABN7IBR0_9BURK|nr:hypothetical protein LMG28140_06050 [Paraburkholderia metrosideri]
MHDQRPLESSGDDEEWLQHCRRAHDPREPPDDRHPGDELPRYHSGTSSVIYPCPACQSLQTEPRHRARRIGGAIGAAAGATSTAAAALSGAEIGATVGTPGGPFGVLCGAIAGAVIAGLAGAAAGCATGAALGETLDQKVLDNWRCRACGHTFSIRPD